MASSGNNEEYKWPNSGQDGPDVEWQHVAIPPPSPMKSPISSNIFNPPISSKEKEDGVKEDNKGEKLPSVEDMKLEGAEGEDESPPLTPMPKMKQVSTLSERYYPTPEEIKQTYPYLDELFMKHGDDIIF